MKFYIIIEMYNISSAPSLTTDTKPISVYLSIRDAQNHVNQLRAHRPYDPKRSLEIVEAIATAVLI